MQRISDSIVPIMVLGIIIYALSKKIHIYDVFVEGSKESYSMILSMFPSLLAMIFGINIFIKSGILMYVFKYFGTILDKMHVPIEILPMAIMRPISGSSSLAILNNLLETYGPDSFIGRLGSVIQGSTDTTFYILTLYFGSIGIKKIRYSLWVGLLADIVGIVSSIIIVNMMFELNPVSWT